MITILRDAVRQILILGIMIMKTKTKEELNMINDQYNMFPLPVFIVGSKNAKIILANDLAQEIGIHANADFYNMIEDKSFFSLLVKDRNKPVRKAAVFTIENNHYHGIIDINDVEFDDQTALLMVLSEIKRASLLSEQETINRICDAYAKNEKNPLFDFIRITAQSMGAFCAALYEIKNGRYTIRDEWRERRCIFVPMLSADFDRSPAEETKRLLHIKRAEDMIYVNYQKKFGTKGVVMYFFDSKIDNTVRDRISKYIDVYKVLAPDEPENSLAAIKKGLERIEQSIGIWDAETKEMLYQNKAFRDKFGSGNARLLENRFPKDYRPGAGPILVYSDAEGRSYSMSHTKSQLGIRKLITTVICDITRFKKAENRLEMLARTDALTGLNNRRAGLEILEKAYFQCKKGGKPLTVCFADIDGLKKINDTYGHGVGDNMIRTVAGIIKKQLDGAGHACRLGGDEFVLILPGHTKDQAMLLAENIEKAVELSFHNDSEAISISFGFKEAEYSEEETSSNLLKAADMNMYKEKQRKV